MNKKAIRIFVSVCVILVMTSTSVFAASTKMVGISNTIQVKSSSKEIHRTVRRHAYINGDLLSVTSNVTYHLVSEGYLNYYLITNVDVQLSGSIADKCSQDTTTYYNGGLTSITTEDGKLIATVEYTIYGKGKLKSNIKSYVK